MIPPPGTGGSNPARNKVVFPTLAQPSTKLPVTSEGGGPESLSCLGFLRILHQIDWLSGRRSQ